LRDKQTKKTMKIKAICTHCGKKQTAEEKDHSLTYVKCKRCNKEGDLTEIKTQKHLKYYFK
jgi:DNA-directed RNA polymerase subunit RPC12/RpoP